MPDKAIHKNIFAKEKLKEKDGGRETLRDRKGRREERGRESTYDTSHRGKKDRTVANTFLSFFFTPLKQT